MTVEDNPGNFRVDKEDMNCGTGLMLSQHKTIQRNHHAVRALCLVFALAPLPLLCGPCLAQHATEALPERSQAHSTPSPLSLPPREWAVDASTNEIPIIERSNLYLRYKMHIVDDKGIMLRDVIESKDGSVARLIERDDRPLTEAEDKAEQDRLNDLIAAPGAYQKHVSNDVSGKKRAVELIKMLPDAMVFAYTPGQPQIDHPAGEQVVMDFKPNPEWKPPSTTAEALTGLQGRVWIDTRTHHMIRMEGDIFQGVNLGWGMLAHIYPGGKLAIEQTAIGQRWTFTKFTEQITVRALMVKTIRQNANVKSSSHTLVPEMGYQDAIRTLLATPLPK